MENLYRSFCDVRGNLPETVLHITVIIILFYGTSCMKCCRLHTFYHNLSLSLCPFTVDLFTSSLSTQHLIHLVSFSLSSSSFYLFILSSASRTQALNRSIRLFRLKGLAITFGTFLLTLWLHNSPVEDRTFAILGKYILLSFYLSFINPLSILMLLNVSLFRK